MFAKIIEHTVNTQTYKILRESMLKQQYGKILFTRCSIFVTYAFIN